MYANRSEHSSRRQYSERSSRQRDEYDNRWDKRRDPPRDMPRESYPKYGGDGRSSTERKKSREYSESPKRLYSKDTLNRDRSRKSPARRRMSSPVRDPSDNKKQRFADDDERDYRYRHEAQEKTYRPSPDSFSRSHLTRNVEDASPQNEDFKYRKTPQDSRHRPLHEEFPYRQLNDELTYRRLSGSYKDGDEYERGRDPSQERARSQERSYVNPRERTDSPLTSIYDEDYRQAGTRFPLNGSSRQSFESDAPSRSAAVSEQKSTKGFQRFLDVLNKGVNVDVLTKIVTQASDDDDQPVSQTLLPSPADHLWSPTHNAGRNQGSHQDNSYWSESERSRRPVSPETHRRSISPKRCPLSDEKPLQGNDGREAYFRSRSRSPLVVERVPLPPEDEHKRRQMQDVLQAIGMDLGFEELGQMSHRIQERLYGKKDGDLARKVGREKGTRRPISPRRQSRASSSSSRSSFSPLNQNYYSKKDSYSAERDVTDVHQVYKSAEYEQKTSSSTVQDSKNCEGKSQESAAALQPFSPNSSYPSSKPPSAPVVPTYPPVNCSPMPYPPVPPAVPPPMPHVGPGVIMPPFVPYPGPPPMNMYPTMLPQASHMFPHHVNHPQPPYFSQSNVSAVQPVNTTQKSKPPTRPRCLQVIQTKKKAR